MNLEASAQKNTAAAGEQLSPAHFKAIKSQLYNAAGITIADHKINMVHNRIAKRIKELDIPTFDGYLTYLDSHKDDEIPNLINALTTNVTHFFREEHHFEHIKKEAAAMIADGQTKIRMWSAGCSIGAEPYSAAISFYEMLQALGKKVDIKILATDIDTTALARGRMGEYHEKHIKGLTKQHITKHFTTVTVAGEKHYKVQDHIRKFVSFNHLNLNDDPWPMRGPFDFVFCRNVFIYFDRDKQNEYVGKMTNLLRHGGYLCLGHSEHFASSNASYKTVGQTTYQKIT